MRKSKVGSDDFCGIEMRSIKKESTKVFVYFESDSTVEKNSQKPLKDHRWPSCQYPTSNC